ncbi:T9SS type A sorting domain-containing protein [Snuella lapsa]|uniref:Secretion system C-terminal sorting domain-containing protein n=1 Tax=Snuella lapsa TaxID=870481 RepID=A0ABP6XQS3_9FLAO
MKNVIKNSKKGILTVSLLTSMLSFANEAPSLFIKNTIEKTIITLNNLKEGNQISIKDANGIIMFKESIQETGTYTKGFDLTSLPNGMYFFEVEKGFEIKIIPFVVESNNVTFEKENSTTIFKPIVRKKNNRLYISKLAPNFEPLHISIYSNSGTADHLIHSETIKNTQIIEKIFDLKEGDYKIVFNSNKRVYTKYINN